MDYKPFLIQKLKTGSPVRDSKEWGVWIKHVPFKIFPDMKNLPSNSWRDEDGDDEYIPDSPKFKAYEISCDFVFIGTHGTANSMITSFIQYLAHNGAFRIYDTYTKIGKTDVRYVSYSEDVFRRRDGKDDIVVFSVTLKVNNPVQNITLTK